MVRILWSLKGGQGVSVTAALIALHHQFQHDQVLLIDGCGDVPAILGQRVQPTVGLTDWLVSQSSPDALDQLIQPLLPQISLLGGGHVGPIRVEPLPERWAHLERWLNNRDETVIVDLGTMPTHTHQLGRIWAELVDWLMQHYHSTLVSRIEYLALRKFFDYESQIDSLALIEHSRQLLNTDDVADMCALPVEIRVVTSEVVAHAIEDGTLAQIEVPRLLEQVQMHS